MKRPSIFAVLFLAGLFPLACSQNYSVSPLPAPTATPTATSTPNGPHWRYLGPADFGGSCQWPSLAVGSGTTIVAYENQSMSTGYNATCLTYTGGSWITVGSAGFAAAGGANVSLAMINGNTPTVACMGGVWQYNAVTWGPFPPVPTGLPGALSQYLGEPYVAYVDISNSNRCLVEDYNGTSWVTLGSPYFSTGAANYLCLVMAGATPYAAFSDGGNGNKASVMTYNGSSWVPVGTAGFSPGAAYYTSLALYGATIDLAFADGTSGKASVMTYNGSNWVNVGAAGFSPGNAGWVSMVIDNGTPYVAFVDASNGNRATVMTYNGSQWVDVGSPDFSPPAQFMSLAVYNGTPYVAFADTGDSGRLCVMVYQ